MDEQLGENESKSTGEAVRLSLPAGELGQGWGQKPLLPNFPEVVAGLTPTLGEIPNMCAPARR